MKGRKKEAVLKRIKELAEEVYRAIEEGSFPEVVIPDRGLSNVVFDGSRGEVILGNKRIRRTARVISHLRPLTQLLWMAYFSKELLESGRTSTLRDVFYSSQAFNVNFKDQEESNEIISDLESLLGFPRGDLNILPEESGSIFGDLTIE